MPLTGAERNRLYRQKLREDPERYAEYLRKERQRYAKRKESGEIKTIDELSARGQRVQRKRWRHRKRRERSRKQNPVQESTSELTPPPTPSPFPIVMRDSENRRNVGRKKVKRERAKAYRKISQLENELRMQKRVNERLRKRLYRAKKNSSEATPIKKTKSMLSGQRVDRNTKRFLLFHNVLVDSLKKRYKQMKNEKQKQLFAKVVISNTLKKYRLQNMAKEALEMSNRRLCYKDKEFIYTQRIQKNKLIKVMSDRVSNFLTRDDNSRIKAGKKATCTKKKEKRQIRLLTDTLKNLYLKFVSENVDRPMSYSMFCRLRPFYVRFPRASDRETCLCKRHENLKFKADKLKDLNVLNNRDLMEIAKDIVCSTSNKECMYRTCKHCKGAKIRFQTDHIDTGDFVNYCEWKTQRIHANSDESGDKVKTVTVKAKEKATIENLMEELESEMNKCCAHFFNIQHQYRSVTELKKRLTEKDVLIHIDFSENYTCKYESEVQSCHFGASQRQISLHTGVIYTKDETVPFCSMSDCLKHNPAGIWGHLKPVLEHVKENIPTVKHLYFLSDGPSTQYKNKENFFLLSTYPFEMHFSAVNWSYTEAGHGKGAPDGVGATVKREADRLVSHGHDIIDADTLYQKLTDGMIGLKLFLVKERDISLVEDSIKAHKLRTIPGTMKIHQIFSASPQTVSFRDVSCFCKVPHPCQCFSPQTSTISSAGENLRSEQAQCQDISSFPDEGTVEFKGILDIDRKHIGQYCVVSYDGQPYPGIIQDVDSTDIEVNVMHSVGENRFFWPRSDDVLWYDCENFITLISPPRKVTRHFEIQKDMWKKIKGYLNL
ncbi:uncharacterized protein LOC123553489 [Mercenaria mercenaria]|uniref:uncharacterized protein LOC123553489 n=1 Tax=Mercenaria mercenaria TaxID=6596 RepID=UPI00234EB7BC|nr:uncharacterized protein LOC123553489 [Mercenaria mercenaria]